MARDAMLGLLRREGPNETDPLEPAGGNGSGGKNRTLEGRSAAEGPQAPRGFKDEGFPREARSLFGAVDVVGE